MSSKLQADSFSNVSLIKTLKTLNIDINQFPDKSFDNICNEKELYHFLNWFCSSFDENNSVTVKDSLSLEPQINKNEVEECFDSGYIHETLSNILSIKESRLQEQRHVLARLNSLENGLRQKEKDALDAYNKASKLLAHEKAMDQSEAVEREVEKTFKICAALDPYMPDLEAFNNPTEQLLESMKSCHSDYIVATENEIAKEEVEIARGKLELTAALTDAKASIEESMSRLPAVSKTSSGCTNPEEILSVALKLNKYEGDCLLHKLGKSEFLNSALAQNRDLLSKLLLNATVAQGFLCLVLSRSETTSQLIQQFNADVMNEITLFKQLVQPSNNTVDTVDQVDGSHAYSQYVPPSEHALSLYHHILARFNKEFQQNSQYWNDVGLILRYYRSGPTLRFNLVPNPVSLLKSDCNNLQEKTTLHLRQLVGSYNQVKESKAEAGNREDELLWVYFLTEPARLTARYEECSTLFSSSAMKSVWEH